MKTDARVKYTKMMIKNVFLELLKEKPVSKITIKEICDKAEINRGTFYKHYQDIYELMETLELEALDNFELLFDSIDTVGVHGMLLAILETLERHRDLFEALSQNKNKNLFLNEMSERCMKYIFPLRSNIASPDLNYTYDYIAGGTSRVIEQWLHTGMKESPEEMSAMIERLIS